MRSLSDNSGYEKAAHLYDLFDQKANIEFFFHFAFQAGEILDIGAGTGRIAIPLAERGVTVCWLSRPCSTYWPCRRHLGEPSPSHAIG